MTGPAGLRRFVRPGPGAPAPAPGSSAAARSPSATAPAPAAPDAGELQASAQSAADALPPLVAQLLQAAPDSAGLDSPGLDSTGLDSTGLDSTGLDSDIPDHAGLPVPGGGRDSEKCELCATEVPPEHGHVADLESSTLVCACRACYLLFTQANAGRGRYRAVPDRYLRDLDRTLTAAQWDQLEIPVGLAFFLRSSTVDRVTGFYPSPAGATECILDLAAWEKLTGEYPLLGAPAPDVEAALICRTDAGVEYFLVPIDACYELAGRMRLHWRGFDGGAEAHASITEFLDKVRSRARAFSPEADREA